MCGRLSWTELPDKRLVYLTTYDLWDTPQGKKIREQLKPEDWWGHSAIKMFYGKMPNIDIGVQRECTDYSTPKNFPPEIALAIKNAKFRDVAEPCMLTQAARLKWAKSDAAWAKWDAARAASSDPFPHFWKLFASQRNRAQAWRDGKEAKKTNAKRK